MNTQSFRCRRRIVDEQASILASLRPHLFTTMAWRGPSLDQHNHYESVAKEVSSLRGCIVDPQEMAASFESAVYKIFGRPEITVLKVHSTERTFELELGAHALLSGQSLATALKSYPEHFAFEMKYVVGAQCAGTWDELPALHNLLGKMHTRGQERLHQAHGLDSYKRTPAALYPFSLLDHKAENYIQTTNGLVRLDLGSFRLGADPILDFFAAADFLNGCVRKSSVEPGDLIVAFLRGAGFDPSDRAVKNFLAERIDDTARKLGSDSFSAFWEEVESEVSSRVERRQG